MDTRRCRRRHCVAIHRMQRTRCMVADCGIAVQCSDHSGCILGGLGESTTGRARKQSASVGKPAAGRLSPAYPCNTRVAPAPVWHSSEFGHHTCLLPRRELGLQVLILRLLLSLLFRYSLLPSRELGLQGSQSACCVCRVMRLVQAMWRYVEE